MKKITIFCFVVMPIIGFGCSNDKPNPIYKFLRHNVQRVQEAFSDEHPQVKAIRERIKKAPGRTGILAERKLYSLFDEELIIRDFFQDRRGGFFLDVGCAWPIKASNTYYLEKHLGWKGIGIDALKDFADEWKKKRPNSKYFNYFVTDQAEGMGTFYKSEELGISSADQTWASGKYFGAQLKTEEIQVPKITLTELLEREGVKKIDLLSLDIEGHELEALMGLDLDRFSPELIVTEFSGGKDELIQYLDKHGYEQIKRYEPFDEVNLYFCRKNKAIDMTRTEVKKTHDSE